MSDTSTNSIEHSIYRDFCNGMKNQSREQIRLSGDIVRRILKGSTTIGKSGESLQGSIGSFTRLDSHLENIDNNLNKLSSITSKHK